MKYSPQTRLLDAGKNGFFVFRRDKEVYIEVRHKGEIVNWKSVGTFASDAEASFAEMLVKLLCAGMTGAIQPEVIEHIARRVTHCAEELGFVSSEAKQPLYFRQDVRPHYDFAYLDTVQNGNVVGRYNVFAELQPRHELTDQPG